MFFSVASYSKSSSLELLWCQKVELGNPLIVLLLIFYLLQWYWKHASWEQGSTTFNSRLIIIKISVACICVGTMKKFFITTLRDWYGWQRTFETSKKLIRNGYRPSTMGEFMKQSWVMRNLRLGLYGALTAAGIGWPWYCIYKFVKETEVLGLTDPV